jgi:hypothetical protein
MDIIEMVGQAKKLLERNTLKVKPFKHCVQYENSIQFGTYVSCVYTMCKIMYSAAVTS